MKGVDEAGLQGISISHGTPLHGVARSCTLGEEEPQSLNRDVEPKKGEGRPRHTLGS